MENIFNGMIEFDSMEEFSDFMENIDKENAIKIIEKQIEYFQKEGAFTLLESATLLKCLNKIKEKDDTTV